MFQVEHKKGQKTKNSWHIVKKHIKKVSFDSYVHKKTNHAAILTKTKKQARKKTTI